MDEPQMDTLTSIAVARLGRPFGSSCWRSGVSENIYKRITLDHDIIAQIRVISVAQFTRCTKRDLISNDPHLSLDWGQVATEYPKVNVYSQRDQVVYASNVSWYERRAQSLAVMAESNHRSSFLTSIFLISDLANPSKTNSNALMITNLTTVKDSLPLSWLSGSRNPTLHENWA
ncbi:hypothetical protein C8R48DRAFT_779295 [Suillus tomentosus]|nr:hypothetical protein C8R48DRAFT_779295 [Suillus tomentosus]